MTAPAKQKPFDALRSQLTYSQEQTAIWKNKAKSEEDRARDLEKKLEAERSISGTATIRLDLLENKFKRLREERTTREQAIVQLGIRLAYYGDPELLPAVGMRTMPSERS